MALQPTKKITSPPSKNDDPPKTRVIVQPFLYGNSITLVVGEAGAGKTFFVTHHPLAEQGFYLDLEDRYATFLQYHPEVKLKKITPNDDVVAGSYCNCLVYDKNLDVDQVKSFDCVAKMVDKAITKKIKLLVIDGISDLRRMATEKWEAMNNKSAFGFQAWGDINNMVKKVLYRAFNFSRIEGLQIYLTTFFAEVYEDGERTGEQVIDTKDYILARIDEVICLYRKGIEFKYKRGKSPRGPTEGYEWTVEGKIVELGEESTQGK